MSQSLSDAKPTAEVVKGRKGGQPEIALPVPKFLQDSVVQKKKDSLAKVMKRSKGGIAVPGTKGKSKTAPASGSHTAAC